MSMFHVIVCSHSPTGGLSFEASTNMRSLHWKITIIHQITEQSSLESLLDIERTVNLIGCEIFKCEIQVVGANYIILLDTGFVNEW